ncbi:Atrophin-1 superfamily incomplete domain containing protein [Pandoravirus celtis]|uniref:Atrophin-1 superfamily incomplete domain containing protein n=1 Tax=Pandoravirus celtis TaxID=2568002 RepID=A0A4D6EGB5_9VIRU|nr:Atrophin-1 superfamily incomplete domain containing protein [Pandoravirus celtis]
MAAARGLTMPLLPSDAASRADPDGRIAGRGGAEGGGSNTGGNAEGGSSYYQMFMRAIHAGGLHGGIFRDEAPLTLLRCMERAAHECLAHVDDALVRKGFVGHVYEEALGRALDTFGAWTGAMLDEETQRIVDAHPQIDTVLFRSVCATYVREVHADILRTGQRASIRLPVFGDFVREFFRHLASDPYVRSAAYFDRTRLAERKLVHADAVRASLEQCMRNKVTFVAAPPPTPTVTSSTASTYATSPVSTSTSSSSSTSTTSSSTSSASSTPSTGSGSALTPSTSTPVPRAAPAPSGSFALRGPDADGALGSHGAPPMRGMASAGDSPVVGKGDSAMRPRERPPATPPAGSHRPTPVRAPLAMAPPRAGPTFAPSDFGPVAGGRLEHEDDSAMGRQRPQIAHAFAGLQDSHRSDRPRPIDGGRPAIAHNAYGAAADQDSTIDVTSTTDGDHRDDDNDESFGDHSNASDRNPDFRQGPPAPQLARGAMTHRRDTMGAPRMGALQAPAPDGGWGAPGHRMPTTGAPPAPLAPPRRGAHARPAIRLVDEPAAPRFAPQNYGGAPSTRPGYAFQQQQQHAGAYRGAMDRNRQVEDDYSDHHDRDDDVNDGDDGDDGNDDDERDDGVMQDDHQHGIYANDGQWSG